MHTSCLNIWLLDRSLLHLIRCSTQWLCRLLQISLNCVFPRVRQIVPHSKGIIRLLVRASHCQGLVFIWSDFKSTIHLNPTFLIYRSVVHLGRTCFLSLWTVELHVLGIHFILFGEQRFKVGFPIGATAFVFLIFLPIDILNAFLLLPTCLWFFHLFLGSLLQAQSVIWFLTGIIVAFK